MGGIFEYVLEVLRIETRRKFYESCYNNLMKNNSHMVVFEI